MIQTGRDRNTDSDGYSDERIKHIYRRQKQGRRKERLDCHKQLSRLQREQAEEKEFRAKADRKESFPDRNLPSFFADIFFLDRNAGKNRTQNAGWQQNDVFVDGKTDGGV
jgi:uncharacterized protein YaiL (DUF2058 family)